MDSFKPRTYVPSLQLKAKVLRRDEAQDLSYVLNLIGAREPKNKLLVEVELAERINTYGWCTSIKTVHPFTLHSSDSRLSPCRSSTCTITR